MSSAARWFARLGAPLEPAERHAIAAYLATLGSAKDTPVRLASSWGEAAAHCSRNADEWWRIEAAERARLARLVDLPDDAIVSESAALMSAARRAGCDDMATAYAASGAATFAAHDARLARAAGASEHHLFLRKLALFEAGRWPLGVYAGEFALF